MMNAPVSRFWHWLTTNPRATGLAVIGGLLLLAASAIAAHSLKFDDHTPVNRNDWRYGADASRSQVKKQFSQPQLIPPEQFDTINVSTAPQLIAAIAQANAKGGQVAIYLASGEYVLAKTLHITADNVWLLSRSTNPYQVVLRGLGMKATEGVHNLITVSADHFALDGVTLTDSPNHLIQIAAERGASFAVMRNCIFQDSYEQMIKVSYDQHKRPDKLSYGGVVEHSIFQYTQGIAPNFYTGGIDALGALQWRVEDNVFRDIASPDKHIAQHAIHFWVNSADNLIRNNLLIDNDRGIGFGMVQSQRRTDTLKYFNQGGRIEGNLIYHADNGDPYGDTGIVLEASPDTVISNNTIVLEHSYPRAIEYRFVETQNVLVADNAANKMIRSRNGGQARLVNNTENLTDADFAEQLQLHLSRLNIETLYQPIEL
ncbi:right-handed parallel beta-helix repeat-containing protein [Neiella marina]|uniref:right-handed parallel beta-helix repeat-containing protein n=1 Tax=Neiella marina TaxID=508461 RepID=UPI001302D47D|nr:right-handed parallel beta-helix repeat-containing protein [Neiella marina]